MNRAWLALAGLVALGAVAVVSERSAAPPPKGMSFLVGDGTMSLDVCRARRLDALSAEFIRSGGYQVLESFSRLTGDCHGQDIALARRQIESALTAGSSDALAIRYAADLRRAGVDSGEWDRLAAMAFYRRFVETGGTVPPDARPPQFLGPALLNLMAESGSRDAGVLRKAIEDLLARPPRLPATEDFFLESWRRYLWLIDRDQGNLMEFRIRMAGRLYPADPARRDLPLTMAAECGLPEAIHLRAELYLDGALLTPQPSSIVGSLVWLDLRTNAESELLAAVLAKSGERLTDQIRNMHLGLFEQGLARSCRHRR